MITKTVPEIVAVPAGLCKSTGSNTEARTSVVGDFDYGIGSTRTRDIETGVCEKNVN